MGENEARPIRCVSWSVAFAFCAWDGGRLPTEAEWNHASAGGSEQREYPWGNAFPNSTYAVYDAAGSAVVGSRLGPGRCHRRARRPMRKAAVAPAALPAAGAVGAPFRGR
ncbi:formylglycine-generating enzyme family protein [Sorangium sp. So ce233]|uniref:formylglycine-generating enzyme family protein n=1 Tax=Sorangium sp. So ce233 TaxID=3133290 RepID=UPI003F6063B7